MNHEKNENATKLCIQVLMSSTEGPPVVKKILPTFQHFLPFCFLHYLHKLFQAVREICLSSCCGYTKMLQQIASVELTQILHCRTENTTHHNTHAISNVKNHQNQPRLCSTMFFLYVYLQHCGFCVFTCNQKSNLLLIPMRIWLVLQKSSKVQSKQNHCKFFIEPN